jgi:mannose/fructose/N-acetylgalactosamine-specific phosphotransferase system component IID
MTIAGSMIVSNANVSTPLVIKAGESSVVLNDVLSEIAPNIIGVATVVTVFALLRKGVSVNKLIIGIFVIGFLLSLVGIL